MYSIYFGDYLIYDLRDDEYCIENPILNEELNKVTELDFSIYDDNPNFDKLEKLKPLIKAYKDNKLIFKGRIIKDQQNMDNSKQVTCENGLAFLLDTVQKPYSFQGIPKDLFRKYINIHNTQVGAFTLTSDVSIDDSKYYFTYNSTDSIYEQVETPDVIHISTYYEIAGDKVIFIGKTTGTNLDNNDYINRSNQSYSNTLDEINSKLINLIGGYIYVSYGNNEELIINWVDDFTTTIGGETAQIVSAQTIEFGENLIDILVENNAESTCSVIIPLGTDLKDADGNVTGKLDISSVNSGSIYLINEVALAAYGWIVAPVEDTTWDDVTDVSRLLTKGQDYLNNKAVMIASKLELTAVDLNVLDRTIDEFSMGEYITCKSTPHNIEKTYLLTKKSTPFQQPENTKITLGEETNTLTGIQLGTQQSTSDLVTKVGIIEQEYVTNAAVANINSEIMTSVTSIVQNSQSIIFTALEDYVQTGDFTTYQNAVSTQLSLLADELSIKFTSTVSSIETLDNETKAAFRELSAYIRGYMNESGQPVLELGSNQSLIVLRQTNDRISFIQNNNEVAYISNNKLVITDGEFLNSLKIGNFAFVPRANGSLDFKKVVNS